METPVKKKPRGKPFAKGNPGRTPGTKNKFPTALKDKVLHACARLESQGKDLASIAEKKPEWFFENFVKPMLPKELWLAVDPSKPLTFRVVDDTSYSRSWESIEVIGVKELNGSEEL